MENNETIFPEEKESIVSNEASTIIGTLILTLVFLIGVPGNLFIIWSILFRIRKRSVTCLLILNLAVADGTLMLLTPFFIVYLALQDWVFGIVLCKTLFYLCCMNMYASIFVITLLSLDRLAAVAWPHKVPILRKKGLVIKVLVILWMMTLAFAIPAVVYRTIRSDPEGGRARENRTVCLAFHQSRGHEVFQYGFETFFGFVVPFSVIVGSYGYILRHLRSSKFQRRIRSEKLILAIIVMFGVLWLPYHVVNLIQVVAVLSPNDLQSRLDHVWKSCRAVTSALAFISSCMNPVLYTFAGKGYMKTAGLNFMAKLFEGTSPDSAEKKAHQAKDQSPQPSKERICQESVELQRSKGTSTVG
ncbi:leukotriene B4 receptor 1-like [Acipenser oxyrinchus oxyrinchus]|uniref:Leukotriene B4 receptor 1-like n=1 Tax=Acipenser oxyrinchus oxyrinchus TaxID=40147 RepID=A0AAD8CK91_ACIOX|nr:leukotriene B4 receptor 1-like [Acipenser oxyrinchus oxyrinchus]